MSNTPLPESQTLVALLPSLARLITAKVEVSEVELSTLLFAIDLDPTPRRVEELERWIVLLQTLFQQPTAALHQATREAFHLRGLPAEAVASALQTLIVAAQTKTPAALPAPPAGSTPNPSLAPEQMQRLFEIELILMIETALGLSQLESLERLPSASEMQLTPLEGELIAEINQLLTPQA